MPRTSAADTRYQLSAAIPFVIAHLICLAAIWTGVGWTEILLAVGLYVARMFGITAGYHRYFSHRSFKTGRVFGFLLAFLAQSSAQRGVLWWASNHRHHHRFSDTDQDVHSPVKRGFWHAHLGWIFTARYAETDLEAIPDFAKYPELRWLDRHPYLPAITLGIAVWALFGWAGLVVGFFWSTVALWHATFCINSLAHVYGAKRYLTGDQSRNNWWLAILTLGEGWHNNHHHFQSSARQGFFWYEVDFTYYGLKLLARLGLVHDLKSPPAHVREPIQKLARSVVEKAAAQLAASFHAAEIAGELREALNQRRAGLSETVEDMQLEVTRLASELRGKLDANVESLAHEMDEMIGHLHLPSMPDSETLRQRATAMFVRTTAMPEIISRARAILLERLLRELELSVGLRSA